MVSAGNGYDIDGAPDERYTSNGGMEVTINFVGPASNRFEFLKSIFGSWKYHYPSGEGVAPDAVCLEKMPSPYVSIGELVTPDPPPEVVVDPGDPPPPEPDPNAPPPLDWCHNPRTGNATVAHCIWPDTWSINPLDSGSEISTEKCNSKVEGNTVEETKPMWMAMDYGCASAISVNYRAKNHGSWPESMKREGTPDIPIGTFIDVKTRTSADIQTVNRFSIQWAPIGSGSYANASFESEQCAKKVPTSPADLTAGVLVTTINLDVTWTNVPLPPWKHINNAIGCSNANAFLGFPPESVVFFGPEYTVQKSFDCTDLYSIHYQFVVKMANATITRGTRAEPNGEDAETSPVALSSAKVLDGKHGVWNQRWVPCALCYKDPDGQGAQGQDKVCTNYAPVEASGSKLFPTYDFADLFKIPVFYNDEVKYSSDPVEILNCGQQ